MKHRGFREEREVRIVAMPQSERALADRGRECELLGRPPIKDVHGNSKKYVALFESLNATLPIKRIIVGRVLTKKKIMNLRERWLLIGTDCDFRDAVYRMICPIACCSSTDISMTTAPPLPR